jgi:hypothetical protein
MSIAFHSVAICALRRSSASFLVSLGTPPMKSLIAKSGLAALALLAFATPAKADSLNFDYYCVGSGSFQACASVRLQSIGNQLTMQVWNLNGTMGTEHTIVDIGLYHAASDWAGVVNSYTVNYINQNGSSTPIDIKKYWTAKAAQDLDNLAGFNIELAAGNDGNAGIIGCTNPGGNQKWQTCWNGGSSYPGAPYVEFTFQLSEHFSLAGTELRWHSQQFGLNNEDSIKCDTGGAGDYPDCDGVTVTPEPGSIVLMATGLIAIVGFVRRRSSITAS